MLSVLKAVVAEKLNQSTSSTLSPCQLSPEDAIDILASARRRHVINHLHEIDSETSIRDLSQHLAEIEDADRKTLHIALYQQHLDKMAEKDVIRYNKRKGEVAPGPYCDVLYHINQEIERKLG